MATARMASEAMASPNRSERQVTAADDVGQREHSEWERLDRQDWHLWLLAVLLMAVLGVSLLSFMFPASFWFGQELAVRAPGRAFVGFSVLLALALVYMLQRQATVRRLKRSLYRANAAIVEVERAASIQAFFSLPDVGQFRDLLAMEFLRVSRSHGHLATVLITVANASREELGRISNLLRDMLRHRESLFRIAETAFGMILPDMTPEDAAAFENVIRGRIRSLAQGLALSAETAVYPEQVNSLAEFDGLLRSVLG